MTAPPAVDVQALSMRLGRRDVLHDVSFSLAAGERVALVGPNGAGKTTLLRALATLLRPRRGHIAIAGVSVATAAAGVRARVGYVGHGPHLYDRLTGRENLTFLSHLYGVTQPASRIADVLAAVGMLDAADRAVATYSRGMQQRVALAAAALHRPTVLLLDEPDAGLDADAIRALPDTLTTLCPEAAVLFSTHDAAVAAALAGRRLTIEAGSVTGGQAAGGVPVPSQRVRGAFATAIWSLLRKDLLVEWRAREQLPTLAVFTLLLALVFDMAFVIPAASEAAAVAAGVLWSSVLLAATLGGVRLFAVEHDRGTLTRLRLAPLDPSAVFVGKWLLLTAESWVIGAVQFGALSVLLDVQLFQGGALAALALAAPALAAVVALQSALVVDSRARELLMPLLAIPLSIPIMLAAMGATLASLQNDVSAQFPWLGLLAVMAAVFLGAALLLYPHAVEA